MTHTTSQLNPENPMTPFISGFSMDHGDSNESFGFRGKLTIQLFNASVRLSSNLKLKKHTKPAMYAALVVGWFTIPFNYS
jgi:hypothetical protein